MTTDRRGEMREAIDAAGGLTAALKELKRPSYPGAAPHSGAHSPVTAEIVKRLYGTEPAHDIAAAVGRSKSYVIAVAHKTTRRLKASAYYRRTRALAFTVDAPLHELDCHLSVRLLNVLRNYGLPEARGADAPTLGQALAGLRGKNRFLLYGVGPVVVDELNRFLAAHDMLRLSPWRDDE